MSVFKDATDEIAELLEEKNEAYGNSFAIAGAFLKLLYPKGVAPEQYQDVLTLVRIFDKLKRIATDKDAFGEDPYRDVAGYAILAFVQRVRKEPSYEDAVDFVQEQHATAQETLKGAIKEMREKEEGKEHKGPWVIEKTQEDGSCSYLKSPNICSWASSYWDAFRFWSFGEAQYVLTDQIPQSDAKIVPATPMPKK